MDLVERCLEIAAATRADDRAWALVKLAADLRRLERYDDALRVLDLASELLGDPRSELAVYTCAIAVHCDRSEHEVAIKLERQVVAGGVDVKFGLACRRLYSELHAKTGDEEHRARRDSYRALVESLEAADSVAA